MKELIDRAVVSTYSIGLLIKRSCFARLTLDATFTTVRSPPELLQDRFACAGKALRPFRRELGQSGQRTLKTRLSVADVYNHR